MLPSSDPEEPDFYPVPRSELIPLYIWTDTWRSTSGCNLCIRRMYVSLSCCLTHWYFRFFCSLVQSHSGSLVLPLMYRRYCLS